MPKSGRRRRRRRTSSGAVTEQSPGPSTDRNNAPVIDPTENVLSLVEAAIQRQDDLRASDSRLYSAEMRHVKEVIDIRASYDEKLRLAEAARIDAIRAVDVGNVARATEVAADQAQALATQLNTTAEAARVAVAATTQQAQITLTTAIQPIQDAVADLRRVQFEQQGARVAQRDDREVRQVTTQGSGFIVSMIMAGVAVVSLIVTLVVLFNKS